MAFLDKFFSRKPSWEFNAGGVVWKLLCSKNILLGDVRDTEKKHASFFALDFRNGEIFWKNVAVREQWWVGMQQALNDTLLLHGYEKPDMPLPKGIYALDVATGELLWENNELTFLFSCNGKSYAEQTGFLKKHFYEIDIRTGNILYDYGENEEGIEQLRRLSSDDDIAEGSVFAEYIQHHDPVTRNVIEKHVDVARVRGGIDVAELNGLAVASYHEPARGAEAALNNIVTNKLIVIDIENGNRLYEDILVRNAPAAIPDTFFIQDGILMYVKERERVTGVALKDIRA